VVSGVSLADFATRSGRWPATQELLETAFHRLNRRCLTAEGFDPPVTPPPRYPVPEDEAAAIGLSERRTAGYGLDADGSTGTAGNGATDPYAERLSPSEQRRYRAALFGPSDQGVRVSLGGGPYVVQPAQGCVAASRRALAGDLAVWARLSYLPQILDDRLAQRALTAPGYLAALADWRACMAGRGHPYRTPEDARSAMKDEHRADRGRTGPSRREIVVAVADGECATQVHLPAAELAARRELVAALPAAERADLTELLTRRSAAVSRAVDSAITIKNGTHGSEKPGVGFWATDQDRPDA
jgi:hypothetical protein